MSLFDIIAGLAAILFLVFMAALWIRDIPKDERFPWSKK